MGLIVDIVPNHVGVDDPQQNRWWWDVLEHGRDSPYASFFDIDWDLDPDGRIVLPVLGPTTTSTTVDGDVLRSATGLPIAPGTGRHRPRGARPPALPADRLAHGICGYRRFFSITSLAGLRQEDRAVFDATHVEVKRWFTEGLVDGMRIDHPDGLSDPAGYLAWLRELVGPDAWIVIEKILAVDEALEPTLPVAGTTGYDALREIGGLFVDPAGEAALTALFESAGVAYDDMPQLARGLKADAVTDTLAQRTGQAAPDHRRRHGRRPPRPARRGRRAAQPHRGLPLRLPGAVRGAARSRWPKPRRRYRNWPQPLAIVAAALANSVEPAVRLQQLCGAATAKSMEDCLFYRDARLVSLNEVGGEPDRFGVSAAEFHQRAAMRARLWPHAMATLTTHDTKRGEDVRARIGVLSQVPSLWAELVGTLGSGQRRRPTLRPDCSCCRTSSACGPSTAR